MLIQLGPGFVISAINDKTSKEDSRLTSSKADKQKSTTHYDNFLTRKGYSKEGRCNASLPCDQTKCKDASLAKISSIKYNLNIFLRKASVR